MLVLTIACNECGVVGTTRERLRYAHLLRKELKDAGWKFLEPGGVDLCPKCLEAKRKEKKGGTSGP